MGKGTGRPRGFMQGGHGKKGEGQSVTCRKGESGACSAKKDLCRDPLLRGKRPSICVVWEEKAIRVTGNWNAASKGRMISFRVLFLGMGGGKKERKDWRFPGKGEK